MPLHHALESTIMEMNFNIAIIASNEFHQYTSSESTSLVFIAVSQKSGIPLSETQSKHTMSIINTLSYYCINLNLHPLARQWCQSQHQQRHSQSHIAKFAWKELRKK